LGGATLIPGLAGWDRRWSKGTSPLRAVLVGYSRSDDHCPAGEVDLGRGDRPGPVGRGEDGDVGDFFVAGLVAGQQALGARGGRLVTVPGGGVARVIVLVVAGW